MPTRRGSVTRTERWLAGLVRLRASAWAATFALVILPAIAVAAPRMPTLRPRAAPALSAAYDLPYMTSRIHRLGGIRMGVTNYGIIGGTGRAWTRVWGNPRDPPSSSRPDRGSTTCGEVRSGSERFAAGIRWSRSVMTVGTGRRSSGPSRSHREPSASERRVRHSNSPPDHRAPMWISARRPSPNRTSWPSYYDTVTNPQLIVDDPVDGRLTRPWASGPTAVVRLDVHASAQDS